MAKTSNEPLKPNPYLTYRDPNTGVWQVINVNSHGVSSQSQAVNCNPSYNNQAPSSTA